MVGFLSVMLGWPVFSLLTLHLCYPNVACSWLHYTLWNILINYMLTRIWRENYGEHPLSLKSLGATFTNFWSSVSPIVIFTYHICVCSKVRTRIFSSFFTFFLFNFLFYLSSFPKWPTLYLVIISLYNTFASIRNKSSC